MKIENQEVVKELGTKDYIQWIIEDSNAPLDSSVRKCFLFITYYPLPDKVPHVPEECYAGAGFQKITQTSVILNLGKTGEKKISGKSGQFSYFIFFQGKWSICRQQRRRAIRLK